MTTISDLNYAILPNNRTPVEQTESELYREHIIAAAAIVITAITGIWANLTLIYLVVKLKSLHNAFGYLCISHAIAEACVLLIFAFWCTPIIFIDATLSDTLAGIKFGQLILFFYFITLYSQLFKAINRLLAISLPILYRIYFTIYNVKWSILASWIIAGLHCMVYFFDGCDFYFDATSYVWTFALTPCGNVIAFYIDFIYGCSLMILILFLDSLTFLFLLDSNKILARGKLENGQNVQIKRKEIRFFLQAVTTSCLYTLMLISFHLISSYCTTKWTIFLSTTFAWEITHTLDGIFLIACNWKLRHTSNSPTQVQAMSAATVATKKTTITPRNSPRGKTISESDNLELGNWN